MIRDSLSLYIHWPFCLSKCPYCDFNSHVELVENHQLWLESYIKEIRYFKNIISGRYLKSIFFGGGTPSLMEPFVIKNIIDYLAEICEIDSFTEITLEANPTSFETAKFEQFKLSGINRVSIGVQALNNLHLKNLGREHDTEQALTAIKSASNIFERISFDLIYARPKQTLDEWQLELKEAIGLAGSHISLYQLTIEKGTPFYKLHKDNKLILPKNEIAADMYEWTTKILKKHEFIRYEISNYAKQNEECRHNLTYWNYEEYLGIGPGAHSRLRNFNVAPGNMKVNPPSIAAVMMWHKPAKWLNNVKEFGHGIQTNEDLTHDETVEEFFMMGLRLKKGIDLNNLRKITDSRIFEILDEKMVKYYCELKLMVYDGNCIFLTDKGLMLHSYLVPRLFIIR